MTSLSFLYNNFPLSRHFAIIKQVNKNIPVILLTGFSGQIDADGAKPAAVDVVLNKPITLDALRHTIRKLVRAT